MGGKGGRRGGSAALPGSPPHLPAAGMMPPRLSSTRALAGPLLPANAANTGAADVLGRQYSPPLAVAPLLLRQLLLLLQLPRGVGVCVGVRRCCCCHCHGGNLAVIVAPSAAVAAAVGGGRTCMMTTTPPCLIGRQSKPDSNGRRRQQRQLSSSRWSRQGSNDWRRRRSGMLNASRRRNYGRLPRQNNARQKRQRPRKPRWCLPQPKWRKTGRTPQSTLISWI